MLSLKRSFYPYLLFLFVGLGLQPLQAQQLTAAQAVAHHVLVELAPEVKPQDWLKVYRRSYPNAPALSQREKLGIRRNIHLFYAQEVVSGEFLNQLRQLPGVLGLQPNGFVQFRQTPNDPLYNTQWHLSRIGLPKVWDQSHGGVTADGDTIVVAIMDSGFEIRHEDLVDNLWINRSEIPGDSLDNDGNGYIDDLYGWDYYSDSPRIAPGWHGLGAAGIIGARGDNGLGVSGINWQLKLMYFSFNRIDQLIRAFEYVIDQRARYNETNGLEGSFVVATNNSFGVENIFCDPPANTVYELWRNSYDALGEVGVLTGASAANRSHDVDQFGDMPATCRSEYLITACNINEDDNLSGTASFGPVSVDLAAPGDGSTSTAPNNNYGGYGQNSAAAPHITGAIALLYSLPCANLGEQARQQPSLMALAIRDAILGGVEPLRSLERKTATGGLLQIGNSWELLRGTFCENRLGQLQIENLYPNPTFGRPLTLEYLTPDNGSYQLAIYNGLGQLLREETIDVDFGGLRTLTIPVDGFPQGVYFLRFGRDQDWISRRFVVAL